MHHSSIHPSSYMPHGFYNPSMNTKSSSSTHAPSIHPSIHHASLVLHPSTPLVGFWCVRCCSTPAPCFLLSLSLSLSLSPSCSSSSSSSSSLSFFCINHLGSVIAECTVVACFLASFSLFSWWVFLFFAARVCRKLICAMLLIAAAAATTTTGSKASFVQLFL